MYCIISYYFFVSFLSSYLILLCSSRNAFSVKSINQKLHESRDEAVRLQRSPSEELKPNHVLHDSLTIYF
jgi:hypothetical protein